MKFFSCSIAILAVSVTVLAPRARALSNGEAATGRLIAQQYADAIVAVRGTALMRITVGEHLLPAKEQKIDVNATVINSTGLVVTSLNGIDLRGTFENMRSQFNAGGQPVELSKTEFRSLRIRLVDGTEIPAKIAWKDQQRDLVFLAPVDDAYANRHPFTFVNLNGDQDAASVLATYYQLSRADEIIQRVLLVRECTVNAIIERPRRLLIVSTDSYSDALGCPIFDPTGRALGICVHFVVDGMPKGTVVLPASDIAAVATNAFAQ
jgi:hypothetical protein